MTNVVTNLNMSDMETGYKLFKSTAIKNIELKENSFGIEPEITIKLAKKKYIFYEVPISYNGRSYEQGKKINIIDFLMGYFDEIKLWKSENVWATKNTLYIFCYGFKKQDIKIKYINEILIMRSIVFTQMYNYFIEVFQSDLQSDKYNSLLHNALYKLLPDNHTIFYVMNDDQVLKAMFFELMTYFDQNATDFLIFKIKK